MEHHYILLLIIHTLHEYCDCETCVDIKLGVSGIQTFKPNTFFSWIVNTKNEGISEDQIRQVESLQQFTFSFVIESSWGSWIVIVGRSVSSDNLKICNMSVVRGVTWLREGQQRTNR